MPPRLRRCAVPAVLAAVLSASAVYSYARSAVEKAVLDEAFAPKPGLTLIDLSRPGSVTVSIPQSSGTRQHGHGLFFYLDIEGDEIPDGPNRLNGLRGELLVCDDKGIEVAHWPLEKGLRCSLASANRYSLGYIGCTRSVPKGDYTMTVTIEVGAPTLAGVETTIYARNAICELEAVPALLWSLLAWLTGVPAAMLWLVTGNRWARWSSFRVRTSE